MSLISHSDIYVAHQEEVQVSHDNLTMSFIFYNLHDIDRTYFQQKNVTSTCDLSCCR